MRPRIRTYTWLMVLLASALCAQRLPGFVPSTEKLTIEQAVAEALEKNLGLLAERANISIADARLITARLRPNPVSSVGGDHLPLLNTRFTLENRAGPPEYNLRTDSLMERAGKRRHRIEVAENARSAVELDFLNATRSAILNVQEAFLEGLLAKESLLLARQNLESLNQIVEFNAARLKAGDIAEVELIRSRLAALQLETIVRQRELKVRIALTRLQRLLSRPRYVTSFDIAGELRRDETVPGVEEIQKPPRESRPDLRALHRELERARSDIRLQLAQGRADYTIRTEYRRQQGVNGESSSLGLFLSIPLPVYNHNQGEIERARQEERQIQLRIRGLESAISGEVEVAYQQVLTARGLLESIESRMLHHAHMVPEVAEYSYRRARATLLEFLDAHRAFSDTMQRHNEACSEYARNLYLLDAVSGKALTR